MLAAMSSPETLDRMTHPEIRIEDPYTVDVNDRIAAAIAASPTGRVRVYMLNAHGEWDTDETADIVELDEHGNVAVIDPGTA